MSPLKKAFEHLPSTEMPSDVLHGAHLGARKHVSWQTLEFHDQLV